MSIVETIEKKTTLRTLFIIILTIIVLLLLQKMKTQQEFNNMIIKDARLFRKDKNFEYIPFFADKAIIIYS